MYAIDPLREPDARMRCLAGMILLGFVILASGLWYLQVVSFKKYERFREIQSFRTMREPAIRGKVLDRNGVPLAENHPNFEVVLHLEDLRPLFQSTFKAAREQHGPLTRAQRGELGKLCRYTVVSNIWYEVTSMVDRPMKLHRRNFERHYNQKLYVPLIVVQNLSRDQVARFAEKGSRIPGVALELQSLRHYPNGTLASHVLGYLKRSDPRTDHRGQDFSYHQPDYHGATGIERIYDDVLRGEPGGKSILINNLMFRQEEHTWFPSVPGDNLYLTLDVRIQRAAESALAEGGEKTLGAVVVMDVTNGDVLAMASSPTYDPNEFIGKISQSRWNELVDKTLNPLLNRATYGIYAPGSIFKIVVGLACLEDGGIDPASTFDSLGYYRLKGRLIKDTAGPGAFDFVRAFAKSSNPYFIHYGLETGIESIVDWGERFYLGHDTGLLPKQELRGAYPSIEDVRRGWHEGETANLCIGQGAIAVTPIQMAVMVSAVANGGTVYWPRLAVRSEPQRMDGKGRHRRFPQGVVRDRINASDRAIRMIHEAMLMDVAGREGTGYLARVEGLNIGGKTGSAETSKRIDGRRIKDTWFASFAPVEDPKYAVVVLVVDGISGGTSCAPIARRIYETIKGLPGRSERSQVEDRLARIVEAYD